MRRRLPAPRRRSPARGRGRGDRRRRGEDAPREVRARGGDDVEEKYGALRVKYRALVAKHAAPSGRASSVAVLALAAMRAGSTALAALHGGRWLVRNERWLRIAAQRRGAWRRADGDGEGRELPTLEALAFSLAGELEASGEGVRVVRCERGEGEAFVEVRIERTRVADPPLVLAAICDVTERVRAERELVRMREAMEAQERLRAVGELASGIAHDLNNTLHALRLRLSRIAGCVSGCPEHEEDLRVVERIAAEAGARVRRLQDLARRREDVPEERVDLGAIVAGAVEVAHLDRSGPAARVSVSVDLPPLPPVLASRAELAHVFVNLFLNARDAMPDGGRITVTGAADPDGHLEISVADEGRGIPSENLDRVFDPFFTTKGRHGTGLGLSMAAGLMRRLGGSIRAANRPEGGAVFTLRFPPPPPLPAPPAPRAPAPAALAPRRVLVVDDDPDNLEAMRLVLEQHGQVVDVTDSGLDAVARVEAGERYDTVLCDLGLGDATGWDVAARIAAAAPATRILLVTGWAEEIPAGDPRRAHVAGVLSKPLGIEDVREILRAPPGGQGATPPRREVGPPPPDP